MATEALRQLDACRFAGPWRGLSRHAGERPLDPEPDLLGAGVSTRCVGPPRSGSDGRVADIGPYDVLGGGRPRG